MNGENVRSDILERVEGEMAKELDKNYNPSQVEERLYNEWLRKKYFHAEAKEGKIPYTIVMPPPNITGQLHMGHALDDTYQDILIRMKRMQGYCALWLPGTDHASISTEVKIVAQMSGEGLTKADIGREEFLKRAWAWKENYGGQITTQLRKLGCSCDWDRERFTMDEGLSKAVLEVFHRLYNKGWIYRGEKLINWCPHCKTTISDAEVDHEERDGKFYHLKYPIKGTDGYIQFATTRPETLLGDTAVAVNPKDERYAKYLGSVVVVPVVNREIPIIADEYVEMDFGTGAVKITPAHDPNDFEVGERHGLEKINVMNDDGTMNENAGKYAGMDRYEARENLLREFKELGLYVKEEPIKHSVGVHERCGVVIEPLIKQQWFVKMEELAKPAIAAYKSGELRFVPDRFGKIYFNWLDNIRDWCISRQLWWGHRIPAYYCESCGHIEVAREHPEKCPNCGHTVLNQDEDTLDTWFSSALWPFSTLGWPEETEDLKYFYPTNVLVTSYDIIFFWVVRMVFSGIENMGEIPFKDVLIHGLMRDSQGRKMSKSLGNGVDPLEVVEKYGADTLRLSIVMGNALGGDLRFYWEKIESGRNFLNKIWNATRFMLMNFDREPELNSGDELTAPDRWILSKVNGLVKEVTDNIEHYELGIAVSKIYDFIWDEFCDWYIEMVKPRLYNQEDKTRDAALWTLRTVLFTSLKLLHPFMPFITEEIFTSVQNREETIMLSPWPKYDEAFNFPKEEKEIGLIKDGVKGIRNIRAEMNVVPSKRIKVIVVSEDGEVREIFEKSKLFTANLAAAGEILVQATKDGVDADAVSVIISGAVIYLPLEDIVDREKERERLNKEREKLKGEVLRIDRKLSNEGFMKKAPEQVIAEERDKREKYLGMLAKVEERLK